VRDRARLSAYRGKLLWGGGPGTPVEAASFLLQREIVLESRLLRNPRRFRFILVHELFHFVWRRLGNRVRAEFAALLHKEQARGSRGVLGESSAAHKERLAEDEPEQNSRAWRNYVCESFCDTAAWLYSGRPQGAAFTLSNGWRRKRAQWFAATFEAGCRC
jgi:hypothetical protein